MLARRRFLRPSLLALLCCSAAASAVAARGVAHPELWPRARSPGLVDPLSEQRISELMGHMSLEEKVGQIIQADIGYITPEDLRRYPLGAVLAGGTSAPDGGSNRTPAAWLALARALRAVLYGEGATGGEITSSAAVAAATMPALLPSAHCMPAAKHHTATTAMNTAL